MKTPYLILVALFCMAGCARPTLVLTPTDSPTLIIETPETPSVVEDPTNEPQQPLPTKTELELKKESIKSALQPLVVMRRDELGDMQVIRYEPQDIGFEGEEGKRVTMKYDQGVADTVSFYVDGEVVGVMYDKSETGNFTDLSKIEFYTIFTTMAGSVPITIESKTFPLYGTTLDVTKRGYVALAIREKESVRSTMVNMDNLTPSFKDVGYNPNLWEASPTARQEVVVAYTAAALKNPNKNGSSINQGDEILRKLRRGEEVDPVPLKWVDGKGVEHDDLWEPRKGIKYVWDADDVTGRRFEYSVIDGRLVIYLSASKIVKNEEVPTTLKFHITAIQVFIKWFDEGKISLIDEKRLNHLGYGTTSASSPDLQTEIFELCIDGVCQ